MSSQMETKTGEPTSMPPEVPCQAEKDADSPAADFECNICLDLAQDPIVTLCGHLYCWPCVYKWLHHHSACQECPVCKALIQEQNLVPLYGRGKTTDPRSKPVPGIEIPNRPAGQRPETAPDPRPEAMNNFENLGFGFVPVANTRFSHFGVSVGFGQAVFPSFFNIQVHGFPDAPTDLGTPFEAQTASGTHVHTVQPLSQTQQADNALKLLFLFVAAAAAHGGNVRSTNHIDKLKGQLSSQFLHNYHLHSK